jgi:diadenosine tetraphosphatase ApaH/serine/threonine PP2A family protein phosphatase
LDECEGILGRIEQLVSAPEVPASTILKIVPTIASATTPNNRTLSSWLQHRLNEIAEHHGGLVPLHGRLFAQWLHYAYPRECNFPHVAGTIDPQRPEDLIKGEQFAQEDISANETMMQRWW